MNITNISERQHLNDQGLTEKEKIEEYLLRANGQFIPHKNEHWHPTARKNWQTIFFKKANTLKYIKEFGILSYFEECIDSKLYDPSNPKNRTSNNPNGYDIPHLSRLIKDDQTIWDKIETIFKTRPLLTGLTYSIILQLIFGLTIPAIITAIVLLTIFMRN